MKIKCPGCGSKFRDELSTCPQCGYTVYESIFGDISAEIDRELSEVTESDLRRVSEEMSGAKAKMTFDEFKEHVQRVTGQRPPLLPKSRIMYEQIIQAQYNDYLRNSGK